MIIEWNTQMDNVETYTRRAIGTLSSLFTDLYQIFIGISRAIFLTILLTTYAIADNCDDYSVERNSVVALFDGSIIKDVRDTPIHNFLELPLNYLGYKVIYLDASAIESFALPDNTAAILSWFAASVPHGMEANRWRLEATTKCGYKPKQIVLGHDGMEFGESDVRDALWARLGLSSQSWERAIGHLSRVAAADSDLVGFEEDYIIGVGAYPILQALPGTRSYLTVEAQAGGDRTDLLTIGPGGAYVHDSATVRYDPRLDAHFWVLNPFAMIETALGSEPYPIADTTTVLGSRAFFATVHSDGWLEPEPSRFFGENVEIAGEILLRQIIVPFPEIPTTVSVLFGDFVPELSGPMGERGKQAALAVYAQPQVNSGTTGHDLVRNWEWVGNAGDTSAVAASQSKTEKGAMVSGAVRALGELFAVNVDAAALRKYAALDFSVAKEITGALGTLSEVAQSRGLAPVFLWTANSRPTEDALRAVKDAGAISIGGGRDPNHPETPVLSSLLPQAARVGSELQVNAALAGDAAYTGHWARDQIGLHFLRQTLDLTETPRRLKPFHLNYSARSAVHFATRSAITQYLELARGGSYIPLPVNDYVAAVEGFESVTFLREGDMRWRVLDRGGLQTLRFDHAEKLALDMSQSDGVVGAIRKVGSLYVSLDPSVQTPLVALTDDANPTGLLLAPGQLAIAKSNRIVTEIAKTQCALTFDVDGTGAAQLTLVAAPDTEIEADIAGAMQTLVTDTKGNVALALPAGGPVHVALRNNCGEG